MKCTALIKCTEIDYRKLSCNCLLKFYDFPNTSALGYSLAIA